jgi:hypothetical protein
MPYVKKIYDNFVKQYGKDAQVRFHKWMKEKPKIAKKAMKTAKSKGDIIIKELPEMVKPKVKKPKKK